jgi:hypothetical protein
MAQYWASVAGEKVRLVQYMNKSDKEIKKAATDITASAASDEEKLRKLYEFCQTQIRNVTFDTTTSEEEKQKLNKIKSLADVLKNKSGDAGSVDLLFGALAKALGFETRIAFSGNRSKMFFDPRMTNESFIHPAAIAVLVGSDWKFFNPGTSFLPYGMLVWYEEDVWALTVG